MYIEIQKDLRAMKLQMTYIPKQFSVKNNLKKKTYNFCCFNEEKKNLLKNKVMTFNSE